MRQKKWIVSILAFSLAGLQGCSSSSPPGCVVNEDCGNPGVLCCKAGSCQNCFEPCTTPCTQASDCQGSCMVCEANCCRSTACDSDDDCPAEGDFKRRCALAPNPATGCRECEYIRCAADTECTDPANPLYIPSCDSGLTPKCKNGACLCTDVCGGECPSGTFCCKSTQSCTPNPDPCPGLACEPCYEPNPNPGGGINLDTCQYEGATCTCTPMPPLEPAFGGQHSAVTLGVVGNPVLSGYYGDPYGDLMYGVATSATAGATVEWEFVDGVPAGAPCEGDPNGPRNGIAQPGDDVGWDTDVAVDAAGLPRISYYDRTNGDLKFASFDGAVWNTHVVDGKGDTGRFTSLVLDASGLPLIAYMTKRDNKMSFMKVVKANKTIPMFTEDWTVYIVDSAPVHCLPSECAAGQACLKSTGLCTATQDPTLCTGGTGCESGFVCVAGVCEEEMASGVDFLPDGVGLFASIDLYANNAPAVAYYDSTNGNLKYAWYNPGRNAFDPPVILAGQDAAGADTGNLGADVALLISSGDKVHLAYQDADLGDLYYMTFTGIQHTGATVELIDAGARDANGFPTTPAAAVGGFHWVGNYNSIAVDSSASVRVAYQDGTSEDLCYAIRFAGNWNIEVLAKKKSGAAFDGAFGFFADQILDGGGSFAIISNFKHNLRTTPYSSGIDLRTR